jgi:inosine triphosphate pyrophosphatase
MLDGFEDKTGYAQCIISYLSADLEKPILFDGRTPVKLISIS